MITYPATAEYPNGFQVRYSFNEFGYLEEVRNNDAGNALDWKLEELTPTLAEVTLGNLVTQTQSYDAITGRLHRIRASSFGETFDVQDLEYAFDTLGNLTRRIDHNRNLEETIDASTGYDALNRVKNVARKTYSTQSTLGTHSVTYDELGNIETKFGVSGSFSYGNPSGCTISHAGPHAVTSAGGHIFCYDENGNEVEGYDFTVGATRVTTWTPFNKPASITDGTDTITFNYGADRARFKQYNSAADTTTLYIDGIYEHEIVGTDKTDIHYIYAGGEVVAIHRSFASGDPETLLLHRDHLGSVVEVTDASGGIETSYSYDVFGKRREASDWSDASGEVTGFKRGYTGHEHLESVSSAIHMNGRVYDAAIGRMISADPYVAFPLLSQSYNRYAYVLNNPLGYTDPSGFAPVGGTAVSTHYELVQSVQWEEIAYFSSPNPSQLDNLKPGDEAMFGGWIHNYSVFVPTVTYGFVETIVYNTSAYGTYEFQSAGGANNSQRGQATHPAYFEQADSAAGRNPALDQAGNRSATPQGGWWDDLSNWGKAFLLWQGVNSEVYEDPELTDYILELNMTQDRLMAAEPILAAGALAGIGLSFNRNGGRLATANTARLTGVRANQLAGSSREALVRAELRALYADASVQSEVYLRTANGRRAVDPLTGEMRRIDSVVFQDGQVLDSVEVTSLTANKAAQIAKENRIRQNGGTFVRDRETGNLIDISQVPTRIVRKD